MENITLITKVALRNDVLSNWNESEDKLLNGEVALGRREDGKYEIRIGVGDKTWNELSGSNVVISTENVIELSSIISSLSTSMNHTDNVLQRQINTISSDYLKSSDKTALENKITAEETRAKGIEGELSVKIDRAIDDLSNTYETKADATTKYNELTGLIDAEEVARVSADEELKKNLSVTVEALAEAEGDYLKTYVVKQGGVQVGAKINIPKDFVIKNASVKTCTENNTPVEGLNVGDKYIDLEVNVTGGTVTSTHLYLPIKDMVDAYAVAKREK